MNDDKKIVDAILRYGAARANQALINLNSGDPVTRRNAANEADESLSNLIVLVMSLQRQARLGAAAEVQNPKSVGPVSVRATA